MFVYRNARKGLALASLALACGAIFAPRDAAAALNSNNLTASNGGWALFSIVTLNYNGLPSRDARSTDGDNSHGNANVPPDQTDISSGSNTGIACNPVQAGTCGTQTSGFVGIYDGGTTWDGVPGSATMQDDWFFFRIRLRGSPDQSGQNAVDFASNHWNTLLDIDGDGWKEFWLDIDGGNDRVNVYYENLNRQDITTTSAPVLQTTFTSCDNTISGTLNTQPCSSKSYTRSLPVTSVFPGDTTGDYFIDLQVPLSALTSNAPCTTTNGSGCAVTPTTGVGTMFTTSASNTDPIQKDTSGVCQRPTDPTTTCTFTDIVSTPVSLSRFEAKRHGGPLLVSFETALETAHAGFELYAMDQPGKVLARFPASKDGRAPATPRNYRAEIASNAQGPFMLIERNSQGHKRKHGPYQLGVAHGSQAGVHEAVDWAAVRQEKHAAERKARSAAVHAARASSAKAPPGPGAALAELDVAAAGLQRVEYADLSAAGISLAGIDPKTLEVAFNGVAVPAHVNAVAPGFGPGSSIEFLARYTPTLYTDRAFYLLRTNSKAARAGVETSAPSAGASTPAYYLDKRRIENQANYSFSSPIPSDPWYEYELFAWGAPAGYGKSFDADGLYPGAPGARLKVGLSGVTDFPAIPDHHVLVSVNGQQLSDSTFNGLASHVVDVALGGALVAAGNELQVTLPGDLAGVDYDLVNYDYLELTYPRSFVARNDALAFDATASAFQASGFASNDVAAWRVQGATHTKLKVATLPSGGGYAARVNGVNKLASYYLATSAAIGRPLVSPALAAQDIRSGTATYLVITHPQFAAAIAPLVQQHQAEGLASSVVDVRQVYRQFGDGRPDADSIARYIAFAAASRGTRYVLLVGGDTYDYKGYLGASVSFIPSRYVNLDDIIRFAPSDAALADTNSDGKPDIAIGRFPARSVAEAQNMVQKSLVVSTQPGVGSIAFAADTSEPGLRFAPVSDKFISLLPAGYSGEQIYIEDLGIAGARAALFDAAASGVDLINFFGHSAPWYWSFDGLLDDVDAAAIGGARPWIANQLGCWNTYHVEATYETIGRTLVAQAAGAVAAMGPTGLATGDEEEKFGAMLLPRVLTAGTRLGDAISGAKAEFAPQAVGSRQIQLGWNLLGDPALRPASPAP